MKWYSCFGSHQASFFFFFSFRNDPNCWWRDGFQVRQWEPGTLPDLLKATSVKALYTPPLQKLLNLQWLRLTHRLLKSEFNDSSASSLKSTVLEGCVYSNHIPDTSTHWQSCEISSNNKFFLVKNAFYLAKSTWIKWGFKRWHRKGRRRDPIWWQGLSNQRRVHQTPPDCKCFTVCLALSPMWTFFMDHLLEYNMGNFPVKQKQK